MLLLDCTLASAPANVALDEVLLDELDQTDGEEVLRFWELPSWTVVIGRASRRDEEVRLDRCRADKLAVVRRCSGGLAIVAGPGCLMYSIVLNVRERPHLQAIDQAHREVLGRLQFVLRDLGQNVVCRGTSDLALGERKFSGNSLRCKRNAVLYHGTILYDFPLEKIERYLHMPHRAPEYRKDRPHSEFVANLDLDPTTLKRALAGSWEARTPRDSLPLEAVERLVETRYSSEEWFLP